MSQQESMSGRLEKEELSYWLAFEKLNVPGFGVSRLKMLVERFDSLKGAWTAEASELAQVPGLNEQAVNQLVLGRDNIDPKSLIAKLDADNIQAFHFYHP